MRKTRHGAALLLAMVGTLAWGGVALAQKPKPSDTKGGAKPPASGTSASPTPSSTTSTPATPSTDAASGEGASAGANAEAGGTVTNKGAALNPGEGTDSGEADYVENPTQRYYFIGLRYRGTIVPKFMMNIFVDEGKTVWSNTIGIELDMRKDGFSLIPAISYVEFGTGDILFKEKNKPSNIIGNYSVINSSLKGLFFTGDLMWSTRLGNSPVEFEYGAGFGLGIMFGDLVTNWVRLDPNGPVAADDGRRFQYCAVAGEGGPGSGCNAADHQNSAVNKVGGYTEPSWANGGSKPNIFPHVSLPQLGLRFKPAKQFEARFGLSFSLAGFWFGLSADYGLEHTEKKSIANGSPRLTF